MHDAKERFAYQVVPGTAEILVFTETLGLARKDASQHFVGLKAMDEMLKAGLRSTKSA